MAEARAAVVRDGPGFGDPPFFRQGGHREWRSTEPEDSHQDREAGGVRDALHGQVPEDSSPESAATKNYPMTDDEGGELAAGVRPTPLDEVRPQGKVERHAGIVYGLVQALDAPVLQMVEHLLDVLQFFATCLPVVAEQVIDVPKISFEGIPMRTPVREPQLAEQLVEVPTILNFLKQTVDILVPRGRGRRLQGFLTEQSSTASVAVQNVDIPVPGRGRQGSGPGQVSAASSSFSRSPAVLDDAEEAFEGVFPRREKSARVAGQVSAQLDGHVSSSTLSAHHVARARVAAHSKPDGELTWVDDNNVTWMLLDVAHGLHWMNLATRHTPWHPPCQSWQWRCLKSSSSSVGVPVLYMVVGPVFGRLRGCGRIPHISSAKLDSEVSEELRTFLLVAVKIWTLFPRPRFDRCYTVDTCHASAPGCFRTVCPHFLREGELES